MTKRIEELRAAMHAAEESRTTADHAAAAAYGAEQAAKKALLEEAARCVMPVYRELRAAGLGIHDLAFVCARMDEGDP